MLLTAILLMALQAKAEPVLPTDDEALGQEQSEVEDQSVAGSVSKDSETVLRDTGERWQHGTTVETHNCGGLVWRMTLRFSLGWPWSLTPIYLSVK